jgi:hypothetical protein
VDLVVLLVGDGAAKQGPLEFHLQPAPSARATALQRE